MARLRDITTCVFTFAAMIFLSISWVGWRRWFSGRVRSAYFSGRCTVGRALGGLLVSLLDSLGNGKKFAIGRWRKGFLAQGRRLLVELDFHPQRSAILRSFVRGPSVGLVRNGSIERLLPPLLFFELGSHFKYKMRHNRYWTPVLRYHCISFRLTSAILASPSSIKISSISAATPFPT